MPYRQLAYLPDRRSTRIAHSVSLTIRGVDADGVPYSEYVTTVTVSCHGCSYESRNSVLLGDVVTLEVAGCDGSGLIIDVPTRVKSVTRLATKQLLFEVAVELNFPDNIWGVAAPPEDWLSAQPSKTLAPANAERGLQVVPRIERTAAPQQVQCGPISGLEKNRCPAEVPPFLALLVASLSEQIAFAARESIRAAVAREAPQLLGELRAQLQDEASIALERAARTSLENLARRTVELNEAYEVAAQRTYEYWARKLEQAKENSSGTENE
jgi:hypothetical protein